MGTHHYRSRDGVHQSRVTLLVLTLNVDSQVRCPYTVSPSPTARETTLEEEREGDYDL